MKDYESKKRLSVIFAKNYPLIVDDYLRDDQEKDASIMSLSVQIFTVPSLALHLIEHCDAMAKLIQGFQALLEDNKEGDTLDLSPWQHDEKSEFQRGLTSLYDLTYLLSVVPAPAQWNSRIRTSFKNGAMKVMEILFWMQGMDEMKEEYRRQEPKVFGVTPSMEERLVNSMMQQGKSSAEYATQLRRVRGEELEGRRWRGGAPWSSRRWWRSRGGGVGEEAGGGDPSHGDDLRRLLVHRRRCRVHRRFVRDTLRLGEHAVEEDGSRLHDYCCNDPCDHS